MFEQHNPQQQTQGIAQSILPVKSKACRSYSTNNQSLDQIMKKANEIIRKSKNSCAANELQNPKGIHGLGESFYALTTADSLQKNGSLSTNRERLKVSPFVTAASPEITEDNKNITLSSGNNNNKTFESCEKTERSSSQQYQEIQQHHHQSQTPRVQTEADYFFENFENVILVSFGDANIIQSQLDEASAGQNSSNSMIRSLLGTFENIRKEQQQQQQQQQIILNQIANSAKHQVSQQQSYLVPKQTQQTSISPYLLLPPTPSPSINHQHSQSQQSAQYQQQPSSQLQNESLDQYLKRPQPAKVKQPTVFSAHPPLPQNVGRSSLQYQNNNKIAINNGMNNSASFRQRHSLKDKENNSDSANSSSFNNNNNSNNHSYYSYGQSQMAPLMCSSNSSRHQPNQQYIFTTPTTGIPQSVQRNNTHQRSSSYIIEGIQNCPPSNPLANSLGYSRPRSDSSVVSGSSEIILPEPHLRTNGTYAPLKTKAILSNKSTDTPTSVRLSSSINNSSNNNSNQPCFVTQRNSLQTNNLPSGYHGIKGNKEYNQQCLLSNLLPTAYKQGQNSIQSGAAYQLMNTNNNNSSNNLSCSNNSRSSSIPKQTLGSQNIPQQK